jgi:hypothetical protein
MINYIKMLTIPFTKLNGITSALIISNYIKAVLLHENVSKVWLNLRGPSRNWGLFLISLQFKTLPKPLEKKCANTGRGQAYSKQRTLLDCTLETIMCWSLRIGKSINLHVPDSWRKFNSIMTMLCICKS